MGIIEEISKAVENLKEKEAIELTKKALEDGEDPIDILTNGVSEGVRVCGDKFERQEYFLPELIISAELAKSCIDIIIPHITSDKKEKKTAKILLATVQGDLHELGKNLVALLLKVSGFEVLDLGTNVPSVKIIQEAEENNVDVIGLSALMVTTLPMQREVIKNLEDAELRNKFKVIVGGAPTTEEWAEQISADGWAKDAPQAVDLVKKIVEGG